MAHITHANAKLTPAGRLDLARCVVEAGWPLRRAAERFQTSVSTAKRWADHYRAHVRAGMADASSRPDHCPRRTPPGGNAAWSNSAAPAGGARHASPHT